MGKARGLPTSTITGKGQTTIPLAIRRHLQLARDRIEFRIKRNGAVAITRAGRR